MSLMNCQNSIKLMLQDMKVKLDSSSKNINVVELLEKFDEILMKHNASEDDSSDEGYFSTMTDENIKDCYKELRQILGEDKYNDIINTILNKGFIENTVDSPYGSVSYFTKGSIGIIVCDDKEAKALAKNLL